MFKLLTPSQRMEIQHFLGKSHSVDPSGRNNRRIKRGFENENANPNDSAKLFLKGYEREVKLNMDDCSDTHNHSLSGKTL